jgi:hypothetical protein
MLKRYGTGRPGLVGVLVARDTGSTVLACGFQVDVFGLGVKNTNGPKSVDRRKHAAHLAGRGKANPVVMTGTTSTQSAGCLGGGRSHRLPGGTLDDLLCHPV